jgi:peptide chain release factor 1
MSIPDKNFILSRISRIESRKQEIDKALEDPDVLKNPDKITAMSREHKQLLPVLRKAAEYRLILKKIEDDTRLLTSSEDAELKELAREELEENYAAKEALESELRILLIPKDPQDAKNAIMEIRPGTGGEEAALFAGDLYRMYSKFVERKGWKKEILHSNPTELGGFKEIIFSISGQNVYGQLKFESGVHRVQRVPTTETGGRIHTSAASVVVLPEAEEVDVDIEPRDLRIDVYRSSGPGGQSVNTTDSAVRITYIPTGMVVTCQDEKSQHKNKSKAMRVLRSRLYDIKRKEEEDKISASRRSMIGSGDRSAKIRTFNFPQGRVTDHRIHLTLYRLQEITAGDLDEFIEKLQMVERDERLKESKQ